MTLTKNQLIKVYNKYCPKFELLPNEQNLNDALEINNPLYFGLNDALEYYERKLKEFKILAIAFKKSEYQIPEFLISNGLNCSKKIRQLKIRMDQGD